MRTIDADALKEDFKSRLADCNEWIEKAKDKETKIRASAVKAFIAEVIMTINNAPTVKTYCYFCGQTEHGKIEQRPQGEWVVVYEENNIKTCKCSKCGRIEDIVDFDKYPFCHCGADMRKGGAE